MEGVSDEEVNPPGPAQDQDAAPVAEPVNPIALPVQTGLGDADAITEEGAPLTTETAAVATVVVPQALIAERVYTPADVTSTVSDGLCEEEE